MLHVTNINSILEIQHSCRSCLTKKHCVACALDQEELREFEGMTRHRRTLRKGQRLFRQGDKFESISIVQSGSVKAYLIADDGEQQISGFHFPGELMGIDGIDTGWQTYNAEALETSSICELSFKEFDLLTGRFERLRHQFFKILGGQLAREKRRMLVLGRLHAEQRLANFILDISSRSSVHYANEDCLNLTMTRNDIANYLGLAVETVSRLLTRFDNLGIASIRHRTLKILQPQLMAEIASGKDSQSLMDNEKIAS